MRYVIVNGSPKSGRANSDSIIDFYMENLEENDVIRLKWNNSNPSMEDFEAIKNCENLLFVFPLYIDTVPSQFLRCLLSLEDYLKENQPDKPIKVFTIINNGYFDARENVLGLEIIRNWCDHVDAIFGGGLAIGAGALMCSLKGTPLEKRFIGRPIRAIDELYLESLLDKPRGIIKMTTPQISWGFYKFLAEASWRIRMRENGLSNKDLHRKL